MSDGDYLSGYADGERSVAAREKFLTVLVNGPLLKSNAAVVLCGEDAGPRAMVGVQLLKAGAADAILLSGGLHRPPRQICALQILPSVYASDVAPDRVLLETESTNTREQAVNVVAMAAEREWTRISLVASPYHAPRAFLTFLKAMQEAGAEFSLRLSVVASNHLGSFPWCKAPQGSGTSRIKLLSRELQKCEDYRDHIASYADGLAYLAAWEGR